MKVRNTTYPTSYAAPAPAKPADPVEPARPVGRSETAGHGQPTDVATVMGIPEAELTPKVRAAIGELMAEVQRLRGELQQAVKRVGYLEELADQDTLTPVLNRRAFVRELSRTISFAERYDSTSSVLYFDLNDMKRINDTHGHGAGDAALSHVADVLVQSVRSSDIVGRLGGDEFGVILAQADRETAMTKAKELAAAIRAKPVEWNGERLVVEVAHGAHTFTGSEKVNDALDAADRAMYAHKQTLASGQGEG